MADTTYTPEGETLKEEVTATRKQVNIYTLEQVDAEIAKWTALRAEFIKAGLAE